MNRIKISSVTDIIEHFEQRLSNAPYPLDDLNVRAYVATTLARFSIDPSPVSTNSVILDLIGALQRNSFTEFQKLGDWIMFSKTFGIAHAKEHAEVFTSVGSTAYSKCYSLSMNRLDLYDTLSKDLREITKITSELFVLDFVI